MNAVTAVSEEFARPIVVVRPRYPFWGNLKDQPRSALALLGILLLPGLIPPLFLRPIWLSLFFYGGLVVVELIALVPTLFFIRRARRRASLSAFPDVLVQVRWNGRQTRIPREEVVQGVRLSLSVYRRLPDKFRVRGPVVLLTDDEGRCLLRLRQVYFQSGDIERVLTALGIPLEDQSGTLVTPKEMTQRYPGAFPWWQAHYLVTALVVTLLVGVLIGLAVALFGAHHH